MRPIEVPFGGARPARGREDLEKTLGRLVARSSWWQTADRTIEQLLRAIGKSAPPPRTAGPTRSRRVFVFRTEGRLPSPLAFSIGFAVRNVLESGPSVPSHWSFGVYSVP